MKNKRTFWIFIFSLIGFLFSGTLTFQKLIIGKCSLTEGCYYFLGYPTCYYGFGFFTILFIISIMLLRKKSDKKSLMKWALYVSLAAVIFSLIFSFLEVFYPTCPLGKCTYSLGIPTCIYGLIMYFIIFFLTLKAKK